LKRSKRRRLEVRREAKVKHHRLKDRLRELNISSPEAFNLLATEFATESVQPEQWWSFEYIDVICVAAQKLHRCTRDLELRARMIGTILQTGVDYNRYSSMQSAADMIEAVQDDREALALLNVLQSLSGLLPAIADRVRTDRLNQHIRALIALSRPDEN